MQKVKTSIQVKMKDKEKNILDNLIIEWSFYIRFLYKRFIESKIRNKLNKKPQNKFSINSYFLDDKILESQKLVLWHVKRNNYKFNIFMDTQIPPTEFLSVLNWRNINSSVLELNDFIQLE